MNSFDSKAYETMVLKQQRVRSLILEHHREKSKEALNDYKLNKRTFNNQRMEDSKEAASDETLKGEGGNNQGTDYSYIAQRETNTSRSGDDINQERINIYARGRTHQNRTGYLIDTNGPCVKRAHSLSQSIYQERISIYNLRIELHQGRTGSIDASGSTFQRAHYRSQPQDQDIQSTLSTCRNRLDLHEGRRLRRHTERHGVDSGFELSMDTQPRRLKNRALSCPLDSDKKYPNEKRNQQNGSCVTTVGMMRTDSQEEMDRLCGKLRENSSATRYRIHSSRALLARYSVDPKTNCEELKEHQTPENGSVEYSSKLCRESFQDPVDLPLLPIRTTYATGTKSINTSLTACSENNDNLIRRINQLKHRLDEIRKRNNPKAPSVTKVTTRSTAFDPFPSTIGKARSPDDTTWPVSAFSSDFLDAGKSLNLSTEGIGYRDTANTSSSSEAETIPSFEKAETSSNSVDTGLNSIESKGLNDEKAETNNDSLDTSLNSKESRKLNILKIISERHTSLICTNNGPKSMKKYRSQKSLASADNSSYTHIGDDSQISSKSKEGPENKGKPRRSSISSFSRAKAVDKEWLVTSISSGEDVQRKKDKQMKEWLRAGIITGGEIFQESSTSGGTMEMLFYDVRPKNFEDQ